MGTRLYPSGEGWSEEQLAKVPEGTAARLASLGTCPNDDAGERAWHDTIMCDDAMETLYHFQLFGWGRLNNPVYDWIIAHNLDPYCGEVTGQDAQVIMVLQGVNLSDEEMAVIPSVSWS